MLWSVIVIVLNVVVDVVAADNVIVKGERGRLGGDGLCTGWSN